MSVVALAAHGFRVRRQSPGVILGLGLVVVPFVPASNLFFLVGTTIGERLLYPSTVGWSLLIVALASRSYTSKMPRLRWQGRILSAMLVALCIVYTWNCHARMRLWLSKWELFGADAQHWGRSAKVLHQFAVELQAAGDLHRALDHYNRSLKIFDDQALTDYCIARILIHLDRFEEARSRFEKILQGHGIGFHDGNDFLWMTDLGYTLVQLGHDREGAHYLQEGLRRMPANCFGWNALGVAQGRLGQLEPALQSLSTGLNCDQGSVSLWNNLALVYAYGNLAQNAQEALQQALALNSSRPAVAHNAQLLGGHAGAGASPAWDLYIPVAR